MRLIRHLVRRQYKVLRGGLIHWDAFYSQHFFCSIWNYLVSVQQKGRKNSKQRIIIINPFCNEEQKLSFVWTETIQFSSISWHYNEDSQ